MAWPAIPGRSESEWRALMRNWLGRAAPRPVPDSRKPPQFRADADGCGMTGSPGGVLGNCCRVLAVGGGLVFHLQLALHFRRRLVSNGEGIRCDAACAAGQPHASFPS